MGFQASLGGPNSAALWLLSKPAARADPTEERAGRAGYIKSGYTETRAGGAEWRSCARATLGCSRPAAQAVHSTATQVSEAKLT
jgi:hypothetical protein